MTNIKQKKLAKEAQIFSRFINQCLAFASVYSVAKKEIKETAPLKGNLVSVFYTENVFIAESGGNIHCANHFENFIQERQQIRVGLYELSFHDQPKHILTSVRTWNVNSYILCTYFLASCRFTC